MSFLSTVDRNRLRCIVEDYEDLSWNDKGDVLNHLKKVYHKQNIIRDPLQAVEELVIRILFELFRRILNVNDLRHKSTWVVNQKRDSNHNRRVHNLVICISRSHKGRRYMKKFNWLNF